MVTIFAQDRFVKLSVFLVLVVMEQEERREGRERDAAPTVQERVLPVSSGKLLTTMK